MYVDKPRCKMCPSLRRALDLSRLEHAADQRAPATDSDLARLLWRALAIRTAARMGAERAWMNLLADGAFWRDVEQALGVMDTEATCVGP